MKKIEAFVSADKWHDVLGLLVREPVRFMFQQVHSFGPETVGTGLFRGNSFPFFPFAMKLEVFVADKHLAGRLFQEVFAAAQCGGFGFTVVMNDMPDVFPGEIVTEKFPHAA